MFQKKNADDFVALDNSSSSNKLLESLNKLRKNKQFCDVILQVSPESTTNLCIAFSREFSLYKIFVYLYIFQNIIQIWPLQKHNFSLLLSNSFYPISTGIVKGGLARGSLSQSSCGKRLALPIRGKYIYKTLSYKKLSHFTRHTLHISRGASYASCGTIPSLPVSLTLDTILTSLFIIKRVNSEHDLTDAVESQVTFKFLLRLQNVI